MINSNIKEEIDLLANWLVSIPSVSNSKGESIIIKAIYDGLSDFSYFKKYREDILYIPHDDQKNNSILAFVENKNTPVTDTLVLIGNVDTLSAERFGQYKSYAFKPFDLKDRIIETSGGLKYNPDDYLFGLGILQCKYGCASMIALVKELSEIQSQLKVNIIFLCLSNTLKDNRGIKSSLEYLDLLIKKKNLNPLLSISTRACDDHIDNNDSTEIFINNKGLINLGFYILGKGASPNSPFSGFSSSLLTSILCKNIELNPRVLQNISPRVQLPLFNNINYRQCASLSSPDSIQISFSLPFFNLDFNDAVDEFKEICAKSIEECSDLLDDRQNLISAIEKKDFIPEVLDAEVITFEDLFERASKIYKGDLRSAIEALSEKCRNDGMDSSLINHAIIDRLNDLARLPHPSIIIYAQNDFIPQQNIQNYSQKDRDTMLLLDTVVANLKDKYPAICISQDTFSHTDANFLHPIALDRALKQIQPLCPLSVQNYYYFNIPSVTLSLKGNDCSYHTERVHSSMGMYIVDFVSAIIFKTHNMHTKDEPRKSTISGISALTESIFLPVKKLFKKKALKDEVSNIFTKELTKDLKNEADNSADSEKSKDGNNNAKTDKSAHSSDTAAVDSHNNGHQISEDIKSDIRPASALNTAHSLNASLAAELSAKGSSVTADSQNVGIKETKESDSSIFTNEATKTVLDNIIKQSQTDDSSRSSDLSSATHEVSDRKDDTEAQNPKPPETETKKI